MNFRSRDPGYQALSIIVLGAVISILALAFALFMEPSTDPVSVQHFFN